MIFGFAMYIGDDDKCSVVKGTLRYLAPELVASILKQNQVVCYYKGNDIWAFGMTVISMVTGHRPWHHESVGNVVPVDEMYKIIIKGPPNIAWFGSLPSELDDFIHCTVTPIHERQSANVLRKHPWLKSASKAESLVKLVQEVIRNTADHFKCHRNRQTHVAS